MAKVNVEKAREHLTALLGVFAGRYQLTEPYEGAGAAAIQGAIASGADADLVGLRAVLAGYNLYPHHEALALAELNGAEAALAGPVVAEPGPDKPIGRMTKAELVALAVERGVTVEGGATVADLRAALIDGEAPKSDAQESQAPDPDLQPDAAPEDDEQSVSEVEPEADEGEPEADE